MHSGDTPLSLLRSRFGYESFRPSQAEIIDNVLAGRDTLALMPTGGGKSICYQLPALLFEGTTLVVSPLIALMKDQVDALNATGIGAGFINSSLSASEVQQVGTRVRQGQVRLLYIAPERLALPGFRRFLHELNMSLIAIDEAHCISEWGHEFRPDYRNLRQLREDFPTVPVIALTATATERVREDIVVQLGLQQGSVFLSSFNRENLRYSVSPKGDSWGRLLSLLEHHRDQSTIIYCLSRRETEDLAADLRDQGFQARPYHAGLDRETRRATQEDFIRDRTPIIVATIAFGMGIDKPDIRLVVHYSLPKSLENYYQETGRAGRDGLPSECVLFYSYGDKIRQDYFINEIEDASEKRNTQQKLVRMVEYAQLSTCRRRFILEYLGEPWPEENCGGCDVCLEPREDFDATEIAQKILSAVIRTDERFGVTHVIRVLLGSRDKRIIELGHERLSVYGIAKGFHRLELRELIQRLQAKGLLVQNGVEYPALAATPEGREFLRSRQPLILSRPVNSRSVGTSGTGRAGSPTATADYDKDLFEQLRDLRRRLADARNVPPYVIFGDTTLRYMAAVLPQTVEGVARAPGVGATKLEQYGRQFLEVIRAYATANGLPDRTDAQPMGQSREAVGRPRERRDRRHSSTHEETAVLLSRGLSISEVAQQRGLAETTVVGHLERISAGGSVLDLTHVLPERDMLDAIESAFKACGSAVLRPVLDLLDSQVTFDELRLARIHLRQEGRIAP